jgi:FMN reductase
MNAVPADGGEHVYRPRIVGIGGTTRPGSSSEKALRSALANAAALGADTEIFAASDVNLPMYAPELPERCEKSAALIAALRRADGLILASPGYHGSISGMLKNALDYVEDMRGDGKPYLDGRSAGLIVCAYGPQAAGSTLVAMRSIIHALRGWPTPLGVAINSSGSAFNADGSPTDSALAEQLRLLASQVVEFARLRASERFT